MHAEEEQSNLTSKANDLADLLREPLLSPKRRPSSASTASENGSPPLKKRDRRRRDAPGGTRNIQKLYRWEAYQRVTKFRALLPLTNNMEPYILGDFKEMQGALQAADRAVLAYYGRGHPLGATNLPHELYEVEQLEGAELADFLLSLAPEGWDRSKAIADRPPKHVSNTTGGSSDTEEASPGAEDHASAHNNDPRVADGDEGGDAEAGQERKSKEPRGKVQPSLKALAKHRRQRLRELQAEQDLKANLGTFTEEPVFKEEGHRASSVFEADRPMTAGPDTRVTRDQFSWANPWSSRFARAYDYAADLRHIARCKVAGIPVEVRMSEDLACSLCGMAGHAARSPACPMRAFAGEPSSAADQRGPLPAWHDKLTPEMEGVLRAVRKVAGACLDAPEMSLFQPLLGSLSPDALLAVGCLLEAQLIAGAEKA
ncbi:g11342 [Coccomyxa viridis]|uniref:G11342 protein n=1 Tax=Coccomyxa viridis TaxID=1274662 RepID=A0ABP1G7W7_9CHLO